MTAPLAVDQYRLISRSELSGSSPALGSMKFGSSFELRCELGGFPAVAARVIGARTSAQAEDNCATLDVVPTRDQIERLRSGERGGADLPPLLRGTSTLTEAR